MFAIACPISCGDEIGALLECGADEFYCGVIVHGHGAFGTSQFFSRRQFADCNLGSVEEAREVVSTAHQNNVQVHLTLNEPFYPGYLYSSLLRYVEILEPVGFDAIIVSDLNLILLLRDAFPEIPLHLSTCASAYNVEAVKFYEELGVQRVILPRQMLIDEIRAVSRGSPLLFEILVLNDRCTFDDGLCYFAHALAEGGETLIDSAGCCLSFQLVGSSGSPGVKRGGQRQENKIRNSLRKYFSNPGRGSACGACSLYYFQDTDMVLKVSGRQNPIQRKIKDVRFLRAVQALVGGEQTGHSAFVQRVREAYRSCYGIACTDDQCYYRQ